MAYKYFDLLLRNYSSFFLLQHWMALYNPIEKHVPDVGTIIFEDIHNKDGVHRRDGADPIFCQVALLL